MPYYPNYQPNSDESEEKKSKYNAAVSQIYRLDNLFQKAEHYRSVGNLKKWNWILDSIWIELASDSNTNENEIYEKFKSIISKYMKNRGIFYQILMRKEIWIRKLQNKQGKGTAYIDDSEDDFE